MVGTRVGGTTDISKRLLRLVKALARSIAMILSGNDPICRAEILDNKMTDLGGHLVLSSIRQ